jgi:diketogulonate reductase-like aldo/keto reductase
MPIASVGHPDTNCSWKGDGPGCAIGQNMTEMWMRLGGRGIDTAADYGSHQAQVGAAVREMVAQKVVTNRSDVFITTKISPDTCSSQAAVAAVRADLAQLGLDYVDLVLQHFPCDTEQENQAMWTGLMQAKALGLTRSIGVSSFSVEQLQGILSLNQAIPAVNQCQMAVGSHDDQTRAFCEQHGITSLLH